MNVRSDNEHRELGEVFNETKRCANLDGNDVTLLPPEQGIIIAESIVTRLRDGCQGQRMLRLQHGTEHDLLWSDREKAWAARSDGPETGRCEGVCN